MILWAGISFLQAILESLIAVSVIWVSIQLVLRWIKIVTAAMLRIKLISIVVILIKGLVSALVIIITLILIGLGAQIRSYLVVRSRLVTSSVRIQKSLILIVLASELLICLQ